MTRIIIHGCNGRMGQFISAMAAGDPEMETVAGVDISGGEGSPWPIFDNIGKCDVQADAVIDFASAGAVDGLLDWCVAHDTPCVLCTTGLSQEQLQKVEEASKKVAILKSANMSIGINLLFKLLAEAAPILADAGFDMEIVERHHNQKLDAPSGTALALADALNGSLDQAYTYAYDRSARRERRPEKEIGISAVRGGTIVGDHDVIFAGRDEVITFSHSAYSREVFARGALQAAKYLAGRPAGYYTMRDVIEG